MDEAMKKLENKRNEWAERVEYHRRASMDAHFKSDYALRDEEMKRCDEALERLRGLNYALEILNN